jgi:hypothetical protein
MNPFVFSPGCFEIDPDSFPNYKDMKKPFNFVLSAN